MGDIAILTVDLLRDFIKDMPGGTLVGVELDNGDFGIIREVTWDQRNGITFKIKVGDVR